MKCKEQPDEKTDVNDKELKWQREQRDRESYGGKDEGKARKN